MLSTDRLRLRPWQNADSVRLRAITNKRSVVRHVGGGRFWTDARVVEFITRQQRHVRELGYCLWALQPLDEIEAAGYVGLQPLGDSGEVEIGWRSTSPTGDGDWRLKPPAVRCAMASRRSAWNGWSPSPSPRTAPR